jgi:hypothetical protein
MFKNVVIPAAAMLVVFGVLMIVSTPIRLLGISVVTLGATGLLASAGSRQFALVTFIGFLVFLGIGAIFESNSLPVWLLSLLR